MIKKQDVTIIIPHFSSSEADYALNECLSSLYESDFPTENIIVATNGNIDDPWAVGGIHVRKQGQCKAVNAAAATVNTKWIMVTNNDMIFPPDWFERLVSRDWGTRNTELDANVMCVSPQLVEPQDGAHTFVKRFFGGVGGDFDKQGFLKFAVEWPLTNGNLRSGFNLPFLIKKEVWDLIGGYDVNYDPWGSNSDSDLEYKLKLAGVQMYQNTNCPVYHFSQTSGTFHPSRQSYWQKNWDYFIEKWGFPRTDDGIWTADFKIPHDKLKYKPFWKDFYSSDAVL